MTAAIIIIVCCWIISFFFNGIESGLLSIDPVRLRQNVKRRLPAALQLNRLLKRPERLLATVLLVTNAADIVALLLLTSQLFRWYGYVGFLFALVIALPVYLFLLSVLPKSLFRRFPFRALARLAGVLEFTSILFSPLLELGALVSHLQLGCLRFGQLLGLNDLDEVTCRVLHHDHAANSSNLDRRAAAGVVDLGAEGVFDIRRQPANAGDAAA